MAMLMTMTYFVDLLSQQNGEDECGSYGGYSGDDL